MQYLLSRWLYALEYGSIMLVIVAIVFAALEQNFSFRPSRKPWRATLLDLEYFFAGLLYPPTVNFGIAAFFAFFSIKRVPPPPAVSPMMFALQLVGALIAVDIQAYIRHRLFHSQTLWPFHSIHHSSEDVNWTSSQRMHPVESLIDTVGESVAFILCARLGTNHQVLAVAGIIVGVWNFFIHANMRWTFGPLRYVLVSPVQHHWHHADSPEAMNKNFAVMFSFLDVLLGTFYMPTMTRLGRTGLSLAEQKTHPKTFFGQFLYPFRAK